MVLLFCYCYCRRLQKSMTPVSCDTRWSCLTYLFVNQSSSSLIVTMYAMCESEPAHPQKPSDRPWKLGNACLHRGFFWCFKTEHQASRRAASVVMNHSVWITGSYVFGCWDGFCAHASYKILAVGLKQCPANFCMHRKRNWPNVCSQRADAFMLHNHWHYHETSRGFCRFFSAAASATFDQQITINFVYCHIKVCDDHRVFLQVIKAAWLPCTEKQLL